MHDVLAGQDERRAIDAFRRLRAGQQLEGILQDRHHTNTHSTLVSSHDRQLRQHFLVSLLQSTEPLWNIVQVATSVLNSSTRMDLPPREAFRPLRDCIITLEALGEIVAEANPAENAHDWSAVVPKTPSLGQHIPDGFHDGPLFWVPASPWTNVVDSDEAVSKLVSTFLSTINPYWRYLEEDLFLRQMRAKNTHGLYCSQLLVNSVLACASVSYHFLSIAHSC